jgi:hypothetical protein
VALGCALPDSPAGTLLGMAAPRQLLLLHLLTAFVLLFGPPYLGIGIDVRGKSPPIALGAAGKITMFLLALLQWLLGMAPGAVAALGPGDLVYAPLFLLALKRRG